MARRKHKRRRNAWMSTGETVTVAIASAGLAIVAVAAIARMRARRAVQICNTVGPAIGGLIPGMESIGLPGAPS